MKFACYYALPAALALCGCDQQQPAEQAATPTSAVPGSRPDVAEATATSRPAEAEAPPVATPIRAGSPEDAIRAYYAAIDDGDFARAYRLWSGEGQASGQTYARFSQGFAETRSTRVTISGPVQSEGAAGSIYATVPVEVNATLKDGKRQRFTGQYVLRRVNDVPGATEEQLNWHIESASLSPA